MFYKENFHQNIGNKQKRILICPAKYVNQQII